MGMSTGHIDVISDNLCYTRNRCIFNVIIYMQNNVELILSSFFIITIIKKDGRARARWAYQEPVENSLDSYRRRFMRSEVILLIRYRRLIQ